MENQDLQSLPFITRDMLSFEHATTFSLICRIQSDSTGPLTIRGATKEGPFTLSLVGSPSSNFAITTRIFNLPDLPIWISINDEDGNFDHGGAYVVMNLGINEDVSRVLLSGYVSRQNPISWPSSNIEPQNPFKRIRTTSGSNPAAGAETSITVPANEMWKLRGWSATLVTDGTAANRIVHLKATWGGVILFETISATTQTASLSRVYSAAIQSPGGAAADDNDIILALPHDIILPQTATITTVTTAIVAGDNWGAPVAYIERFLDK